MTHGCAHPEKPFVISRVSVFCAYVQTVLSTDHSDLSLEYCFVLIILNSALCFSKKCTGTGKVIFSVSVFQFNHNFKIVT